ncbi:MAG: hypothetical protein KAI69_00160 [Deltaproteobacteria bacterium]|nr:hypothetical protein [Deltaproteobacteria bacterium]
MVKIVIACSKKPLAAFLETELAAYEVDCRVVADAAQLMAVTAEFKPDLLLFDSEFPSSEESSGLLGSSPQIPVVGIFEPFGETQDEVRQGFSPENVLQLPFGGDVLREKLQQVGGREIKKRVVLQEKKEEEKMDKPQSVVVETFELTEIVEEGLPLDELPEISEGETSGVLPEVDSEKIDTGVSEPEDELVETFEVDDFGDTLDDLESTFEESADIPEPESSVEGEAEAALSELVSGDVDALLGDDEFAEVEIPDRPEVHDPVLAELKSAGLKPESDLASTMEAGLPEEPELEVEGDFGEEELSDIDDLLGEIPIEEDAAIESPVDAGSEKKDPDKVVEADFSELVCLEADVDSEVLEEQAEVTEASAGEVLSQAPILKEPETPETSEAVELVENPAAPTVSSAPEKISVGESLESEVESPEDYLMDEELPEIGVKSESAAPEVYAEPISPDFSRQIESMTQEWSKQLLQTTYASMDKMIKAIGDLAPTIVDQVAREVIPPLAEKVIKAEIARLEEKLESEEEKEERS